MKIEGTITKRVKVGRIVVCLQIQDNRVFVEAKQLPQQIPFNKLTPDTYVKIEAEENPKGLLHATSIEVIPYDIMMTRELNVTKEKAERIAQQLQQRGYRILLHPARVGTHKATGWVRARGVGLGPKEMKLLEVWTNLINLIDLDDGRGRLLRGQSIEEMLDDFQQKHPPRGNVGFLHHCTLATQQERAYVAKAQQAGWRPRRTT